jgi:S-adenosyl methyltransferase
VGTSPSESGRAALPPRLDTSSAHSARVWNYLLGGKDNFAADREVGDLTLVSPGVVTTSQWRPDLADASAEPREVDAICGVGRKD